MTPSWLIDPRPYTDRIPMAGLEEIRRKNPQRFEMEQLSGILEFDAAMETIIGFKEITDREFWVKGHIPGQPLMPGVIMLEAAAQLCSYLYHTRIKPEDQRFFGFSGLEAVRFRHQVRPKGRLILAAQCRALRTRRIRFLTQGFYQEQLAFEATILAMPLGPVTT